MLFFVCLLGFFFGGGGGFGFFCFVFVCLLLFFFLVLYSRACVDLISFLVSPCWSGGKGVRVERGRSGGLISARAVGIFAGRFIPVTSKLALQWLPCQAPGVVGSALGLVGQVSVYCDWVK